MIVLNNLTKKLGNRNVLDNLTYKFNDVGFYVIIGINGSGKTTLLNILALLDNKYEGEFYIDEINQKNEKQINKDNYRFKNINYIRPKNNIPSFMSINDLTSLVGDNNLIDNDIFSNIKKSNQLSGGEEILLTLLLLNKSNRKIILADEITSQLDKENTEVIFNYLLKESQSKLIIFATHDKRITSKNNIHKVLLDGGKLYDKNWKCHF